jgi:hypothetical protein
VAARLGLKQVKKRHLIRSGAARYSGHGSPDDEANYTTVVSPVVNVTTYDREGAPFYAPDFLKQYAVSDRVLR